VGLVAKETQKAGILNCHAVDECVGATYLAWHSWFAVRALWSCRGRGHASRILEVVRLRVLLAERLRFTRRSRTILTAMHCSKPVSRGDIGEVASEEVAICC
jgi:hypothetical protein